MPWILDGNNLAGGGDRERVRRAALAVARGERVRLLVFFDGAPPAGSAPVVGLGQVELRYVPHADSAIVAHLVGRGTGWVLATDDRQLGARAKALGARVVSGSEFWAKVARAAAAGSAGSPAADLDAEMAYFRDRSARLPGAPTPIRRRTRRR
jgi:hypothetical protein